MTKLEAVNLILKRAGSFAVSVLDTGGASWAAHAERMIDDEELRIQQQSWHYNLRRQVTLSPAGDGKIYVPTGCLWIDSSGSSSNMDVTQLGDHLYNVDDNTETFTADLIVDYRLRYEWACIPLFVRQYIALCAACEFVDNVATSRRNLLPRLEEAKLRAKIQAERSDNEARDVNILTQSDLVATRGRPQGSPITDILPEYRQ